MSIDYYVGVAHPCVNVESKKDLYEIIDILHTQVLDNLEDDGECIPILEDAMLKLDPIGTLLDE